jgi:hypothetical protein
VADRWALVIAVDNYLDPEWGLVPFAESGARALADALAAAGYPTERQFVLLGPHATKSVIESRLRKLKKAVRRGGEVLAYVAGCGFSRSGSGFLACWDTLPDDPAETALPVADLVAALTATRAGQVVVLLDVGLGAPLPDAAPADMRPTLDASELASLFGESPKAVGLTSARPDEPAYAAARLKAGVWTALLVDALAGRAAKALDPDGHVTAASLQRFAEGEMPRLLRKHFDPGDVQTPQLYGEHNAGIILADLSHLVGGGDGLLDPGRLRRVAFRSESLGRVKDLTDWRKTYEMPDAPRPSAKRFVARVANADVKADLDEVYEAARERLGYKRKDLDAATGPDGFGVLRTPDFEYTVTAALDTEDPSRVAWRREIGGFADPGFVRSPEFDAVFGKLFDQLVFEFAAPVDVESLVDRLEDRPVKGVKVHVSSDGGSCDVTLAGFAGRVTVDRHALTVRGRAGNSAGLLDQFLAFLQTVGPLGERAALPPGR